MPGWQNGKAVDSALVYKLGIPRTGILTTVAEAPDPNRATPSSDAQYRLRAESALERIERHCDAWLESGMADIDTQRTGGLLELSFAGGARIVVNLQPPLQELWLAAHSGGYHYRWRDDGWRDTRDGSEFFAVLSREASTMAGADLVFTAT
jgi:CyaY protein